MKYTTIPAGYKLIVTSWENDGDDYRVQELCGLSKEEIKFYVDLCMLFKSGAHGNLYEPSEQELDDLNNAFLELCKKHSHLKEIDEFLNEEHDEFIVDDFLSEFHERILSWSSGGFHTRVFESFKVEYYPEELKIQDVTEEFK